MSGKWWKRCAAVAIADVIAFALTIRSHDDFHRTATGPAVMSVGQVLGWIVSGALLVALGLMIVSGRHERR